MNLEDARQHYYTHTASLSSVNRQLCFAGIAVVWIFAVEGADGAYSLPTSLVIPLSCFVLGLAFDLCQYIISSASWGLYHRHIEKSGIGEEADFGAPRQINWAPNLFFWLKPCATLIGYISLLVILAS